MEDSVTMGRYSHCPRESSMGPMREELRSVQSHRLGGLLGLLPGLLF